MPIAFKHLLNLLDPLGVGCETFPINIWRGDGTRSDGTFQGEALRPLGPVAGHCPNASDIFLPCGRSLAGLT